MNGIKKGRPINLDRVVKAKQYRKNGLSYRKIAKKMGRDVHTIFRWVNYVVDKVI